MYVISKIENIVSGLSGIWTRAQTIPTQALYGLSYTSRLYVISNVRWIEVKFTNINSKYVRKSGKRALYWSLHYIKGPLYWGFTVGLKQKEILLIDKWRMNVVDGKEVRNLLIEVY